MVVKKKFKQVISLLVVVGVLALGGASMAYAASFGNRLSGASSTESFPIKYNGAAWNYSSSPYKSTSFTYVRNGTTLMNKVAYNGKVTGSVWDDLRWGDKYTTKFYWKRGALK